MLKDNGLSDGLRRRFAKVSVGILLNIPTASTKAFVLAASLGRFFECGPDGPDFRSTANPTAVLVQRPQRERIISALEISDSYWRRCVRDWTNAGVAHRCTRRDVCLFFKPETTCPRCGKDVVPSTLSTTVTDPDSSTETDLPVPQYRNPQFRLNGTESSDTNGTHGSDSDLCAYCGEPFTRLFPNQVEHLACQDEREAVSA